MINFLCDVLRNEQLVSYFGTLSNNRLPSVQVSEWEAVVYGKTEDQLIMTEQARQYLNPYPSSGSTSRALVL